MAAIDRLWVSVEDDKPNNGQFVIVWIDRSWAGKAQSSAGRCHYYEDEGFDLVNPGGEVTHWMSWPQADPNEEEREGFGPWGRGLGNPNYIEED